MCRRTLIIYFLYFLGKTIVLKKKHTINDSVLNKIARKHPSSLTITHCNTKNITIEGLRHLFRNCSQSLKVSFDALRFFIFMLFVIHYFLRNGVGTEGGRKGDYATFFLFLFPFPLCCFFSLSFSLLLLHKCLLQLVSCMKVIQIDTVRHVKHVLLVNAGDLKSET